MTRELVDDTTEEGKAISKLLPIKPQIKKKKYQSSRNGQRRKKKHVVRMMFFQTLSLLMYLGCERKTNLHVRGGKETESSEERQDEGIVPRNS